MGDVWLVAGGWLIVIPVALGANDCDWVRDWGHVTYPHRPHGACPPSIAPDPSPEISIEKCEYTQIANEIRGNCPYFDPFSGGAGAV